MFDRVRDDFDYSDVLDEIEVARFVQRIESATDGIDD